MVEWIGTLKPVIQAAGPWGLATVVVLMVVVSMLREGLVSGASFRRSDEQHRQETERLVASWEARLAESRAREDQWRNVAGENARRADVAAEQTEALLRYLHVLDDILNCLHTYGVVVRTGGLGAHNGLNGGTPGVVIDHD